MRQSDQIFHPEEFGQPTIVEDLRAEIAQLRSQLAEAHKDADRLGADAMELAGQVEIYRQLKISNKPDYWRGVGNGVCAAVTWLHRRALEMADPAARSILHKAGSDLAELKAHHSVAELEKLSRLQSALSNPKPEE